MYHFKTTSMCLSPSSVLAVESYLAEIPVPNQGPITDYFSFRVCFTLESILPSRMGRIEIDVPWPVPNVWIFANWFSDICVSLATFFAGEYRVNNEEWGGDGGWERKGKNTKSFWYPAQKISSPGQMAQTPRADTGDSVGWFRRYWCSTLFNYHSNLSMCGTFLQKSIHLPDNRRLLATSKEINNLNVSAVTQRIWSCRTPTSTFCTKELYNPGFFLLSLHPLGGGDLGEYVFVNSADSSSLSEKFPHGLTATRHFGVWICDCFYYLKQ